MKYLYTHEITHHDLVPRSLLDGGCWMSLTMQLQVVIHTWA